MAKFTLKELEKRIRRRAKARPDLSYTRKLLDRGVTQCAKKLGEEAMEAVIAATTESRQRLIAETSDLLYHLLVLLHARKIKLSDVEMELAKRRGMTGLEEKASRKRP